MPLNKKVPEGPEGLIIRGEGGLIIGRMDQKERYHYH